jgi:exodeoxyribonuclease V alpha subunit
MPMNGTEELTGTIEKSIYQHPDNGFCVMVMVLANKQSTIVTGHLAHVQPGQDITVQGAWKMHPKFGKQFEVAQCIAHTPNTVLGLKKYLGSGLIKGIGPAYAEKLVARFGLDVLKIIEHEPHRLSSVPGIGPKRVEKIIAGWHDQKEISNIMLFLLERGVSTSFATKIYKTYGQQSLDVLKENPYRLVDDIWGVGFKAADKLAQQLGIAPYSLERVRAGIAHAISVIVQEGHLYAELNALKDKSIELLELEKATLEPVVKQALQDLYSEEKIKLISIANEHFVTLSKYYFSEKGVANKIRRLMDSTTVLNRFDIDAVYASLRVPKDSDIALNEDQQRGIMACLQQRVSIITGGPGTGKTTLIKKLLMILDENKCTYKLAAPTGRAAKRIQEGTGKFAMTLHRMLEFDFTTMQFVHNEQNALKTDFLIIDEASMIDVFLANALLKAVPLNAHVVFIGDIDQLPSVGAGNFLNDLIASGVVPTIRLIEIFRQAQDSLIIVNAHRVNKGEFPTTQIPNSKKDFVYIREDDPATVNDHLRTIFARLPSYHISPADTAVLVPMNRGVVGTHAINYYLQELLNPGQPEKPLVRAGTTYKVNDRVMQIRNNYDKLVFNGDTGTITSIDTDEQALVVNFGDREVSYEYSEVDELVLAYAMSIHKSQGSEYAATVIPIFTCHFTLLQRNLLYTAITRSKRLCILIGQPKAIAIAIKNNKGITRKTFLKEYLTTDLQCR